MTSHVPRSCRALLALVLGACGTLASLGTAPAALAAGPCPVNEGCIVVSVVGGARTTITVDQLAEGAEFATDLPETTPYRIRDRQGQTKPISAYVSTARYLSVRGLVDALGRRPAFAGLDPASVRWARIAVPGDRESYLDDTAFRAAGDNGFADGLQPAVLVDADVAGFVRPLRPDPADVNIDDLVTRGDAPFEIEISTRGSLVQPTITATPAAATVGDPVRFEGSVDGSDAGLTYDWDFGDGTTARGRSVEHAFDRTSGAGFRVRLRVSGADGSGGSALTVVRVTDPAALTPRIVATPARPEPGQEVRFSVELDPVAGATYAWDFGDGSTSTQAAPRHAFEAARRPVVRVVVTAGARRGSDALEVTTAATPPPPGPPGPPGQPGPGDGSSTPDPTAAPDPDGAGGSADGGLSPDPDAPVTGPDEGTGTQEGGTTGEQPPTGPGSPTPPGGLTGILLTGASTPLDVVPLPESTTAQQPASAAGARARTSPGAAGGDRGRGPLLWGFAVVPLLLLLGAARETG